jgi:hypothetical protein
MLIQLIPSCSIFFTLSIDIDGFQLQEKKIFASIGYLLAPPPFIEAL